MGKETEEKAFKEKEKIYCGTHKRES